MPNTNPTIVSASLSDKELQDSINKMVANFDKGLQTMLEHSNEYVGKIQESLQKIGNTNFGAKGSNDGGVVKQTKAQNDFTDAVKKSTDEIKRQGKEAATSFDNFSKAQQVAIRSANPSEIRNADTLQTMNIQLDLLRERLREARQQYSSFVALAAHATTTGDKGLFQYATDGVHRYEQEVRNLIPQIRTLQSGIQQMGDVIAPQGHTIQNYVNSLQKANPELAALNAQYKSGTSLLQDQSTSYASATQSAQRYTEEIRKQAAEIRKMPEWKQGKDIIVPTPSGYDAVVNSQKKLSLEEQLLQVYKQQEGQKSQLSQLENTQNTTAKERLGTEQAITQEIEKRGKKYVSPTINDDAYQITRNAIARKLGIDTSKVINADAQYDSIKRVGNALKQLQDAYARMTNEERNSPIGKQMIRQMQELQRQSQQLRAQMSRPISLKDALSGSEKTLDDIAYKMQRLRAYKQGIDLTKPNATNEIKQVDEALAKLQKDADKWMSKSQQMIKSNTALGRSWNYMKNRLAFYFTVGASTSFVKQLIDIRGQYELLERSIGILIDSAQNGSQIFAELNAMAIKSPFTTMELGAAAKQLVAYDVAAKDVVDTTRRLADMAAAVGIPIERLTYALGQIKAYGYLNARDARMFANAGIPLVKELADYYTELEGRLVSTADVYDRIKKKAIDYNDVMSVVNKMTDEGGKFFDFQEKAADTLKVRIANLTLAWNNMLNEMGKDNQGILTEGLKVTKQIFESWRDINNMVIALGFTYGTIKAAQIAYYLWVMRTEKAVGAWSKIINAIDYAFNAKIANAINSLKTSLVGFFTNPSAMLAVAFTALSVALTKAYLDYRDLQAANEEFNKSVAKNAEENIKSIDKFFGDYKKQLESVGSLNSADQTKLWERVQEEIEKTTKNAEKYIEILNKIPEVSKRIEVGESVLEQSKRIQDELKYMAERGMFNVGGGFANDSAAKDLQQYSDAVNELITKYGDLDNAKKEALKVNEIPLESGETIRQYTGEYVDFQRAQIEAEKELQNIVSTLDKVNMAEILGTGDMETQLANVRSFAIAWRDAFLATEKGSKISAEGQALLNSYIDKWIEQQARVNHLIKDENTAAVEANRTAWETFFKFLNTEERKRLDVAIKTNQLGSKSVQELWDNAAERMQEKATTSYNLIQQQIADLRNTPDIVINVVYRNNKEKLEKDQEEFEKKYIQPKDWGVLSTDEYLNQEKANREKYGTLMRKQGEDTAEYEKRISDERKKNLELSKKNGKIIEENKNKTSEYSIAVTELADKEKKAADDRLKVIKEIEEDSGYDFSTKSERAAANKAASKAESELAKALKDELSTIDKVRSIYKDLTKEGMSHADAVERATRGWDETVDAINRVLRKNGLQKLDLSKFAGIENPRELVNMLQSQLNTLLKRGAKPAEIKELQTKVNTLEVDADKYDLTKITKGLNNELGKLKDEYELAVELDANPEMGNMFTQMFGLDTTDFPKTIDEYMQRVQQEFDKMRKDRNFSAPLNIFKAGDKEWEEWGRKVGLVVDVFDKNGNVIDKNTDALDKLTPKFKEAQGVAKKWAQDTIKATQDLEYKLGDLAKKVEIEEAKLAVLEDEAANNTNAAQKHLLELQIQQQKEAIEKLKMESVKLLPFYEDLFGDMYNVSVGRLKEIAKAAKEVMSPRQGDSGVGYTQRTDDKGKVVYDIFAKDKQGNIKKTTVSLEEYIKINKQIDSVQQKIAESSPWEKIKDSFSKKEGGGLKNFASGMEAIGGELQKVANITKEIGGFAEALGADENTVETINDIATSIGGVATAAQGIGQIASGDYLGGVVNVASGLFSAISTWFDNGDKKILQQIKDSERAVSRLELAYTDLEHAVNKAYGAGVVGAKRALAAEKELELAELERQLTLERSRKSKNRDEDKIIELQKRIKELRYEIVDSIREITDELLGSDVGSFAENLVSSMAQAFKQGEDYMKVFNEQFDNMIDNMIIKSIVSKVVAQRIESLWDSMDEMIKVRSDKESDTYAKAIQERERLESMGFEGWANQLGGVNWRMLNKEGQDALRNAYDRLLATAQSAEDEAKMAYDAATQITDSDIGELITQVNTIKPELAESLKNALGLYWQFGQDKTSELSALQQGISQISETTAESLEAYMNGVSQQVYLHSDLLTQIRDAVVGMDMDVQVATQAQMLLQLQQSYAVQMAIQGILEGWNNPSGQAVRVELVS